jgi:hypothetical protein
MQMKFIPPVAALVLGAASLFAKRRKPLLER